VESKLFDCPFRVAAPLLGGCSWSVPLKSQLCECLAAKKGTTFLPFRSKTDPSSDLQWMRNESFELLLSASLFLPLLSLSFSFSFLLYISSWVIVSRLPYCRGREALPKAIFLREAIQMSKNGREIHVWLILTHGGYVHRSVLKVNGCTCFMNHIY